MRKNFNIVHSVHCERTCKLYQHQQMDSYIYIMYLLSICSYMFRSNRLPQGAHCCMF